MESKDPDIRYQAMESLHELDVDQLAIPVFIDMIKAAGKQYPEPIDDMDDPSFCIMTFVYEYSHPDMMNAIEKAFPTMSPRAKSKALEMLQLLNRKSSVELYMKLLQNEGLDTEIPYLHLEGFSDEGKYASILFPALVPYAKHDYFAEEVYRLAISYIENKNMEPNVVQDLEPFVLKQLKELLPEFYRYQSSLSHHNMWNVWKESYFEIRTNIGLFMNMLAYFQSEEVQRLLNEMKDKTNDEYVQTFIVQALLSHNKKELLDEEYLYHIAKNHEARNILYSILDERDSLTLFPKEFCTDEAFALSDMTLWLIRHSDYYKAPTVIEYVSSYKDPEEVEKYHLVRFKMDHEELEDDCYYVGLVGAQEFSAPPSPYNTGVTFSIFTKLNEDTVENHMNNLYDALQEHIIETINEEIITFHPKLSYGALGLLVLVAAKFLMSFKQLTTEDYYFYGFFALIALIGLGVSLYKRKKVSVTLLIGGIEYINNGNTTIIDYSDVAHFEKIKDKWQKGEQLLPTPFKTKFYQFKDENGEVILRIPEKYVDVDNFETIIFNAIGEEKMEMSA